MGRGRRTEGQGVATPSRARQVMVAAAVAVVGLLVVCFVIAWSWRAGATPDEAMPGLVGAGEVITDSAGAADAVAVAKSAGGVASRALMSDDPAVVAAAVVELRDDWFYAEDGPLKASIGEVFVEPGSPGALFVLNGLSLQRASLWDAPEINKTMYFSEALSARVLHVEPGEAVVEVWDMEVISRRELIEPQSQWGLQRLFLVRDEGDTRWLVFDWKAEQGPAPGLTVGQRASSATEMEIDLDGHGRVRDWMGSTEAVAS